MKLLLHACCAPCLIIPYENLSKDFQVSVLWYNPNIHPLTEQMKRLEAIKIFETEMEAKVIYQTQYHLTEFFREIVFRENNRCGFCYYDRLKTTAVIAKKGNFDFFSTTLQQSHQQDREQIISFSKELSEIYKIRFYEFDFRYDWKRGVEISKKLGMYRRQYCGCIYSEKERYEKQYEKFTQKLKEKSL